MTLTRSGVLLLAAVTSAAACGGSTSGPGPAAPVQLPFFSSAAVRVGSSPPMRSLQPGRGGGTVHPNKKTHPPAPRHDPGGPVVDPVRQSQPGNEFDPPDAAFSFDGIRIGGGSLRVAPPDPSGAAGPHHYVQVVNLRFAVFDKTTGAHLFVAGPLPTNSLWTGLGGPCEMNNDGDPVVVYDRLADRWIISQFMVSGSPNLQCVAVSKTGDPTGEYWQYAFAYPDGFPDYPKMGVWPDAYYITFNMFPNAGPGFLGGRVCAYDRARMLNGSPATQQCFHLGPDFGSLLPADLEGDRPPPEGSPGYLLDYGSADEAKLNLWKFHVDWKDPAATTLTGPVAIPVAHFTEPCNGTFNCIPQLGTNRLLDSLGDRLMFRLVYRNFPDHASLVVNHSVAVGKSVGVRWYELRGFEADGPVIYQQSTYAPDDEFRWMGSIAINKAGSIGLGFSISSPLRPPGLGFTGRLASDTLGEMSEGEGVLTQGVGSQTSLSRWGDYSQLTVDPADDCTFWYTGEYLKASGGFNWATRIGSFRIGSCDDGPAKLHGLKVNPHVIEGGGGAIGSLVLSNVAGAGGLEVALAADDPAVSMPASVTVPEGKQRATFPISTSAVAAETVVAISASLPGSPTLTAGLTLEPAPTPAALAFNPSTVMGGQDSQATVTLSGPAPAGGAMVAVTSSNPAVATADPVVVIAEGETTGPFTVHTLPRPTGATVGFTVSYHGLSRGALLTVTRTLPQGNAVYDPALGAPRCTEVQSLCDSGGLIDGRDNISNGQELNAPNTVESACLDGPLGSYHADESLDRLRVSTTDNSPMAVGKTVQIEATVWAFDETDSLDLYFAPDARNPVWVPLATLVPQQPGVNVLIASLVLPDAPLPVIRGNFRYAGEPGACTGGGWDDHDDLVFTIQGSSPPPEE